MKQTYLGFGIQYSSDKSASLDIMPLGPVFALVVEIFAYYQEMKSTNIMIRFTKLFLSRFLSSEMQRRTQTLMARVIVKIKRGDQIAMDIKWLAS